MHIDEPGNTTLPALSFTIALTATCVLFATYPGIIGYHILRHYSRNMNSEYS